MRARAPRRPVVWLASQQLSMHGSITVSDSTTQDINSGAALATLVNNPVYTLMAMRGFLRIHGIPFAGATPCTTGCTVEVWNAVGFFPDEQAVFPSLNTDRDSEEWFYFDQSILIMSAEESDAGLVIAQPDVTKVIHNKAMRRVEKAARMKMVWKLETCLVAGVINTAEVQSDISARFLVKI